jgi:hypothetical protein
MNDGEKQKLLEEIAFLGRAITLGTFFTRWCLSMIAVLVGLLLAEILLGKDAPIWFLWTLIGLSVVPALVLPFGDEIAKRCTWIPEDHGP